MQRQLVDLAIFLSLPWLAIIPIYLLRRLRLLAIGLSLGTLVMQALALQLVALDRQSVFLGLEMVLDLPARAFLLLILGVTALLVAFVWRADSDALLPVVAPVLVALAGAALAAQSVVVAGTLLILLAVATAVLVPRGPAHAGLLAGEHALGGAASALKPLVVVTPAFVCFVLAVGWEQTYQLNPDFIYLPGRIAIAWALAFAAILAVVPFHLVVPGLGQGRLTGLVYALALVDGVAVIQILRLLDSRPWLPPLATPWLMAAGVLTVLIGGVLALGQRRLGRLVAYSAIADLGWILVGVGTAKTLGLTGAVLQVGSRVLVLALLAAAVTNLRRYEPDDRLDELHGLARVLPWTTWGLIVGALALVGLPPTFGFVGRLMTLEAVRGSDPMWLAGLLIGMAGVVLAYVRVVGALFVGGLHGAGVALLWLGICGLLSLALGYAFLRGIL